MQRIYPAAPFGMQAYVRTCAEQLAKLGYDITGRWLQQKPSFTQAGGVTIKGQATWDACQAFSERDIPDELQADTLLHFSPGKALERNTHIAELGGALFTGRQVITIAPQGEFDRDVIGCIFERFQKIPESWAYDNDLPSELRRIKPVIRYESFTAFITDIVNPIEVECCSGCGTEYRKRDCGCPAGSYKKMVTPVTGLNVLRTNGYGKLLRDAGALASLGI